MTGRDSPLYLLSGLLCDDTVWSGVADCLAVRIPVTIVNFPNFSSITAMAEHVLQNAPERFSVAGHSMGGRVLLEMIRLAPGRVQRVALLNTGVHSRREAEFASRGKLVRLAQEQGMSALAAEWLPPMMGAPPSRVAAVMPRLRAMVEGQTPGSFDAQTTALLQRPEAESVLRSLVVPTLLLSGTGDRWSPVSQHEDMLRQVPHAVLEVIQEAGHMAPVEQPAAVAAALGPWLDR